MASQKRFLLLILKYNTFSEWKECLEQPEAIARSLSYGARIDGNKNRVVLGGLDKNTEMLSSVCVSDE